MKRVNDFLSILRRVKSFGMLLRGRREHCPEHGQNQRIFPTYSAHSFYRPHNPKSVPRASPFCVPSSPPSGDRCQQDARATTPGRLETPSRARADPAVPAEIPDVRRDLIFAPRQRPPELRERPPNRRPRFQQLESRKDLRSPHLLAATSLPHLRQQRKRALNIFSEGSRHAGRLTDRSQNKVSLLGPTYSR